MLPFALIAALAASAVSTPTPAPPSAGKPAPAQARRIAVFDLEATGIEPSLAKAASVTLPTEVRRALPSARVIGSAEVQSMLGLERQKALLGCTDQGCLAEIGGALGVEELLSGRLAKVGKTFVLELRRTDVKKARVTGSTVRTVKGEEDALLEAVHSAVDELYLADRLTAAPLPPAPLAAAVPAPAVTPPSTLTGKLMVAGGGLLVLGGVAGLVLAGADSSAYDAQQGKPWEATVLRSDADAAKTTWNVSAASVAVGAGLAAWGGWKWYQAGRTAVTVAPTPGGLTLVAGGSF